MHKDKVIAQILLVLSILNLVATVPVVTQEVRGTSHDVVVAAEDVTTASKRQRRGEESGGTTSSQFPQSSPDGSSTHGSLPLGGSALLQSSAPSSSLAPSSYYFSATDRVPASTHPLSGAGAPAPAPDWGASTSAHPLSESANTPDYYGPYGVSSDASVDDIKKAYKKMALNRPNANLDGPVPVPDPNTEASTSSQRPVPQSVSTATAEGSTTPQYTAVTHEMLDNGQAEHTKENVFAGLALLGLVTTAIVVYAAFHHHNTNSTAGTVDMKYQTNANGGS